jgi:ubiquinone/menaquinone biosynthesis C-methylase UbiE
MSRQGEARERTLGAVKDFWNKEAAEWGENPQVTIRDHFFRLLEIETVAEELRGGADALDIGCGTGFSTLHYASVVGRITGQDFSEKMVHYAQEFLASETYRNATLAKFRYDLPLQPRVDNVSFDVGDITALKDADASHDAVVAERVLINMPTRELQYQAVRELARVTRRGGKCILVEVTRQGHQRMDELRTQFGLPIIEKYWHNLYVDEAWFVPVLEECGFSVQKVLRFEPYQFLTKVVHPLTVAPDEPKFLADFNLAALRTGRRFRGLTQPKSAEAVDTFAEQRRQLQALGYDRLPQFDQVVRRVLDAQADFTACSHQVLFGLKRV